MSDHIPPGTKPTGTSKERAQGFADGLHEDADQLLAEGGASYMDESDFLHEAANLLVTQANELERLQQRLDDWYRVEARLYVALNRRFGADAMAEAITEVTTDIKGHNPQIGASDETNVAPADTYPHPMAWLGFPAGPTPKYDLVYSGTTRLPGYIYKPIYTPENHPSAVRDALKANA